MLPISELFVDLKLKISLVVPEATLLFTQHEKVNLELLFELNKLEEGTNIWSFIPSKLYALFPLPNRSVINVAPFTVPLFPLPLSSLALPQNGQ